MVPQCHLVRSERGFPEWDGFYRRTGVQNRRYKCASEYHFAPKSPWRDVPRRDLGAAAPESAEARKTSHSAISTETPVFALKTEQ